MLRKLSLNEDFLNLIINKSIKRVLNEAKKGKYDLSSVYIVFDGTSYYPVYGCDVEDEIADNDVEVVEGPFRTWDSKVDDRVDDLNDEAQGTRYDRRRNYY